ncbi:LysM peptidoglycan-binding domain-containing protein, partial [Acinetobacter venetianus]
MKKVLNGIQSFHALGLKKQLIAVAICAGLGMSVNLAHAASPNVSPPSVKAGAPNVYVVKKGDTLWDISGKFLSKPWRWPEIWASNKHVKNPHWIYPGDKLLLCSLNGKPLIGKDEGDGCDGIIRRYSGNTSNLRPQVRIEALNNSVPVIPLAHIQQWLERTSVLPAEAIANTPYILGTADNRVLAGKGQSVYVRGQGLENGQRYGVFREGQPYIVLDQNGKKQNLG